MANEPKKVNCPNCQGPAIKEDNKIICENCDATFSYTKTGGAKVKEIGRLDSLEKRMDRVESILPGQDPEPPEPISDGEPEEKSILGSE